jgi:hypothetical protein
MANEYGTDASSSGKEGGGTPWGLIGGAVGMGLPVLYNLGMGIFNKPKKYKASSYYNPYEKDILGLMKSGIDITNKENPANQYYTSALGDVDSYANSANSATNTAEGKAHGFIDESSKQARTYSDQSIDTLRNRKFNIDPILEEARLASRVGSKDAQQYSSTGAEYLNRRRLLGAEKMRNVSRAYADKNNYENQYKVDLSNALLGRAGMETQIGQSKASITNEMLAKRLANYGLAAQMRTGLKGQQASSASDWEKAKLDVLNNNANIYNQLGGQKVYAKIYADDMSAKAQAQRLSYFDNAVGGLGDLGKNLFQYFSNK